MCHVCAVGLLLAVMQDASATHVVRQRLCDHEYRRVVPGTPHTDARAGHPGDVSRFAHPSDTGRYVGYRVGGGAARGERSLTPDEGTWGWDYMGFCRRHIRLGWTRRDQGGGGSYKTDGPHRPNKEHPLPAK